MAEACGYIVISVPEGCTKYWVGEIVYYQCDPPCLPTVVNDGTNCSGTGLYPVSQQCVET
jgi:hypothetical protein